MKTRHGTIQLHANFLQLSFGAFFSSIRVCFYLFKVAIDNFYAGFDWNVHAYNLKKRISHEMNVKQGVSNFNCTRMHLTMSAGTWVSQIFADDFVYRFIINKLTSIKKRLPCIKCATALS